jgi:hypothetical protein
MNDMNGELIRKGATAIARDLRITIEGVYGRDEGGRAILIQNPAEVEVVANPVVVVDGAGYGHVVPT